MTSNFFYAIIKETTKVFIIKQQMGFNEMTLAELENIATKFSVKIIKLAEDLKAKKQDSLAEWLALSGTTMAAKISRSKGAFDAEDFISELSESMNKANETLYWLNVIFEAELINTVKYELLKYNCNKIRIELSKAIKKANEL